MLISARILRRDAEAFDPDPPVLTRKQERQRERILVIGRALLARHGRHAISMSAFATALNLGTGTVRRHFPDLDALHAAIVEVHLGELRRALRDVPHSIPDREKALRAAYFAAARASPGRLWDGHLLLTRDRHLLPEDELEPIARAAQSLGSLLAGDLGTEALALLDDPRLGLPAIETMLAALSPPALPAPQESDPATPRETAAPRQDAAPKPRLRRAAPRSRPLPLHEPGFHPEARAGPARLTR